MLPVNVDGMIWLNTIYSSYHLSFFQGIALSVCFAITFVFSLCGLGGIWSRGLKKEEGIAFIGISVVAALIFAAMINFCINKKNTFVPEPISYSVYFEENMDYKTLYKNYNIVSTEGNIVTIELKEK